MKELRDFVRLFMVVGVAALLGGVALWVNTRMFVARAHSVPGTVVRLESYEDSDHDTLYRPIVEYKKLNGQDASFSGHGSKPAAYDVGEAVTVLYDPNDPSDSRIADFWQLWGASAGVFALGTIFIVVTFGMIQASRSGAQHKQYLRVNGTPIKTELTGVERNERLEVNGVNPWRITSRGVDPASGEMRTFHSENLWFDPTEFMKVKQVTVLLDPRRPKRYYMDISFLPQQ